MKQNHPSNHKKRNFLLLTLLAGCCIAGSEVAAISHYEPALYQRITAPVRSACEQAAEFTEEAVDQLHEAQEAAQAARAARVARAEQEARQRAEELESQVATDPVLVEPIVLADPSDTELQTIDGQEILTGGSVETVYFNQTDPCWADLPYGKDTIGRYGCGPTAMAMVIASLTDESVDPSSMAQFAVSHGYWASKSGSYHSIVSGIASAFGLQVESFSGRTPEELYDALLSGQILVALMGPGHFTQSGHFILLRGATLNGEILVADPSSRERSLTLWDPEIILDELSASTSNGAPLWAIQP